ASPVATPTMFASWIPMLKKRSGNCLPKVQLKVDFARSASIATMSRFALPSSSRASPYASRVARPRVILKRVTGMKGEVIGSIGQLRQRDLELVLRGCLAMELVVVLHERHALAFD